MRYKIEICGHSEVLEQGPAERLIYTIDFIKDTFNYGIPYHYKEIEDKVGYILDGLSTEDLLNELKRRVLSKEKHDHE